MPTSSTTVPDAAASSDEGFRPPKLPIVTGDPSDFSSSSFSSISGLTQAFHFSSGNPRIEEIRGVVHLFRDEVSSSSSSSTSTLPVERKPLVCVLGVPNHMTYADFCQFCGSFIHDILEMRVVRCNCSTDAPVFAVTEFLYKYTESRLGFYLFLCLYHFCLGYRGDGMEDRYSILIRFGNQDSADNFYKHLNERRYSSLEAEVCHVVFMVDVQYTASIEHAQASPASSTEQPSCPVCLDKLDQDTSGILTTICNHSFHCFCISKWTDSSCPVCRYCQQQPEKSVCFVCQTSENLWICVICGFVGCGKYKEGHAIVHWKDTQHCYSLELETQRVWDYAGDNYVHRLIQSKTDGKLVELNSHCAHAIDGCRSCGTEDAATSEALLNSRVELIVNEYNELLTTQLENQKLYFESLLQEVKEETEREISRAVEKAINQKLHKMQAKLAKGIKEKNFLDDLNENLLKNQEIWGKKILEIEERFSGHAQSCPLWTQCFKMCSRERRTLEAKDNKIQDLEGQLRDLMAYLESGQQMEQLSISSKATDSSVLPISAEPSSKNNAKGGSKPNKRRG